VRALADAGAFFGTDAEMAGLSAPFTVPTNNDDVVAVFFKSPKGTSLSDFALGGPGSGHFDHAGRPGEVGGSADDDNESTGAATEPLELRANTEKPRKTSDKSKKATESHVPVTPLDRALAKEGQDLIAKWTGGIQRDENDPTDTRVEIARWHVGLEVKTLTSQQNNPEKPIGKLTVHVAPKGEKANLRYKDNSLGRKQHWLVSSKRNFGAMMAVDYRDRRPGNEHSYSGHRVYYKAGFGSYRVHTMTLVRNAAHLRALIKADADRSRRP
jgi:hypothetical protein